MNNICPFFFFFYAVAGSRKDKERVGLIPEIHLILCANSSRRFPWKGRAAWAAKPVLQSYPQLRKDSAYRYCRHTHLLSFGMFVTHTSLCFCVIVQEVLSTCWYSAFSFAASSVWSFVQDPAIQKHLHSLIIRIVKDFSITVYTLDSRDDEQSFIIHTNANTVNWEWQNNMEDSFKAQEECQMHVQNQ